MCAKPHGYSLSATGPKNAEKRSMCLKGHMISGSASFDWMPTMCLTVSKACSFPFV